MAQLTTKELAEHKRLFVKLLGGKAKPKEVARAYELLHKMRAA